MIAFISLHHASVVNFTIHSMSCCDPVSVLSHLDKYIAEVQYGNTLLDWLPRTSQTTVAFCRILVVAHCGPIPMTFGSCLFHEHITKSVIGVSRPLVLDCGTTFHLDYGGRDLPSTLSDNL